MVMDRICLVLVIIGAIVWGLIGFFNFNLIGAIFGGTMVTWSRIIYSVVGLAGLWTISLLFRNRSRERIH